MTGDIHDLMTLVDSIYRLTSIGSENEACLFSISNRLLGLCYDIRHAYQGDRDLILVENGMNHELMKRQQQLAPLQNVYYHVNLLFPDVLFVTMSVKTLYTVAKKRIGLGNFEEGIPPYSMAQYSKDKAYMDYFCAGIWGTVQEILGQEETDKLLHYYERTGENYLNYAAQYIDKLTVEYVKTELEKRKDKLKYVIRRIAKKSVAYTELEATLLKCAKEYGTSIHELQDPKLKYPTEIVW